MDWGLAIRRNREDLLKIIAMIFMTMGIAVGASVSTLPRRVYYAAQRILRPAESGMRRVIFMRMRGMDVSEYEPRPAPRPSKPRARSAKRALAFPLIDIRKSFDERPVFNATGHWASKPIPSDGDPIDAKTLFRRLDALRHALDDLPGQAKRMARLMARRKKAPPGPGCVPPLRPGFPPGYRQRHVHLVDRILQDCHHFARHAQNEAYAPP